MRQDDVWAVVTEAVERSSVERLVERGVMLGLPVAHLPDALAAPVIATEPLAPLPLRARRLGDARQTTSLDRILVVDLSSLWAGPLCGALLHAAGADVVKVESIHRPDGARSGPPLFFDLLNAGKRSVALDIASPEGRRQLLHLLSVADVVIEASRPRALEQLGIEPEELVTGGGPRVWVSITGHGRDGPGRDRVAFGDDAAVAGGLVSWDDEGPCFCADAVADPTSGLVAAAAVLDALAAGGRWLLDVSMAGVATDLAGPTLPAGDKPPEPPRIRPPAGRAATLGEHTDEVLEQLTGRR